jgi:hypothetical protein
MKRPQSKPYYLSLASKSGVAYISVNGDKKTIAELRPGKK